MRDGFSNALDSPDTVGFDPSMKATKERNPPDLRQAAEKEAKTLRIKAAQMIQRGEMKPFLIKHGFLTESGKLPKRYGG